MTISDEAVEAAARALDANYNPDLLYSGRHGSTVPRCDSCGRFTTDFKVTGRLIHSMHDNPDYDETLQCVRCQGLEAL